MNLYKYSDTSIVIGGETYANRSLLRELGGTWNKNLKNPPKQGWVFPINHLNNPKLQTFIQNNIPSNRRVGFSSDEIFVQNGTKEDTKEETKEDSKGDMKVDIDEKELDLLIENAQKTLKFLINLKQSRKQSPTPTPFVEESSSVIESDDSDVDILSTAPPLKLFS